MLCHLQFSLLGKWEGTKGGSGHYTARIFFKYVENKLTYEREKGEETSMGISYQLFINLSISLNTELSKNILLEFRESSPKYFPGRPKIHYGSTHSRNLADSFHMYMPPPGHDEMQRKKKQDWLRRRFHRFLLHVYLSPLLV